MSQIGLELGNPKSPPIFAFALALSDLAPSVINDGIPQYYDAVPKPERWTTGDAVPDHIVVVDNRDYLKPLGLGQTLITVPAGSLMKGLKYVTAYAIKPDEYDQALCRADILTPDIPAAPVFRGLDAAFLPNKGASFARWMVNDSSELHFISSSAQALGIYMESSAAYDGIMNIEFNDAAAGQITVKNTSQKQSNNLCVTTKTGSNVLKFIHKDADAIEINRVLVYKLLFAPVDTLDIGAVEDARQIGKGWEAQENWGEETVPWSTQDAQLQIMTCDEANKHTLHFRAFLPQNLGGQNVTISINGTAVGAVEMRAGWKEYTVIIPPDLVQKTGLQSIALHHRNTFVPTADTRTLSAAYDQFWFTNN